MWNDIVLITTYYWNDIVLITTYYLKKLLPRKLSPTFSLGVPVVLLLDTNLIVPNPNMGQDLRLELD